jgi:hypothetical protein
MPSCAAEIVNSAFAVRVAGAPIAEYFCASGAAYRRAMDAYHPILCAILFCNCTTLCASGAGATVVPPGDIAVL